MVSQSTKAQHRNM